MEPFYHPIHSIANRAVAFQRPEIATRGDCRWKHHMTIQPYWSGATWVFDDPQVGLRAEPFVAGVPDMIDRLLERAGLPPRERFLLIFSAQPFPGHQAELEWVREEDGGNWYRSDGMEGWLCPALFKYFQSAPARIYCQIRPGSAHQ